MEGFGLPPLEAMAYGTPVISSNTSCMPEILGNAAIYFDPTDTNNIASVISDTIYSPEKLEAMKQAGFDQVKKYSWERMAQETHAIYTKVLGS